MDNDKIEKQPNHDENIPENFSEEILNESQGNDIAIETEVTETQSLNEQSQQKIKKFKLNKKWIILGCAILGVLIIIISILSINKIDSNSIALEMQRNNSHITKIVTYSENDDPNELLGEKYQYSSKTSFQDDRLSDDDRIHGGTIEVFDSIQELNLRKYYLENLYSSFEKELTQYGQYGKMQLADMKMYIFSYQNILLRVDGALSETQANEYKDFLLNKSYNFKDKDVMNSDEYNDQLSILDTKIAQNTQDAKDKLSQTINEIRTNVDTAIKKAEQSLSKDDIASAKALYDYIDRTYFANDIISWDQRLAAVNENIKRTFISQCQNYSYDEILRNSNNYVGKKAHFKGEVVQVIESTSSGSVLRVNVTKSAYFWEDTIYVVYTNEDGNTSRFIEDDIIDIYGTLGGLKTYTAVLGNSITIPQINAPYIVIN